MKVIHLPTSVGGNSYGLAKAEQSIGLDSRILYVNENWLQYPADIVLPKTTNIVNKVLTLVKYANAVYGKYDVYHFNFGSTLLDLPEYGLDLLELPFIKNGKIVVTYNGCDARQKYRRMQQTENCACKYSECYAGRCIDVSVEEHKRKRIEKFEKYASNILALNPDLMNMLPTNTQFLPYTVAGWNEIVTDYDKNRFNKKKKITIVHAPTNRIAKGSDVIIKTITNLQKKYPDKIELKLVEKLPYMEALQIYKTADIIIDQIRIGWYGAFAVEAMKMGKAVIAYINEEDLHFIPTEMAKECREAMISANESNIEETLLEILNNIQYLRNKNEAQIDYVYKWHDPQYVASITKKIYEV